MELAPPLWVRCGDGRLMPFQADRICRSLFAATEDLGRPDAFLARELTDSVVHFLAEEVSGAPTTTEVAEVVVKVVRELGQPELAHRFGVLRQQPVPAVGKQAEQVGDDWRKTCAEAALPQLPALSRSDVFPRELLSAQRNGLLTLTGLDHPFELSGSVLRPASGHVPTGQALRDALEAARAHTGVWVAIDSPDHALASMPGDAPVLAAEYARELKAGLRSTGLAAKVNLNHEQPPAWVRDLGEGPLFAELRAPANPARRAELAVALLDELLLGDANPAESVSAAWHLSAADFADDGRPRLIELARRAGQGQPLEFVFDRPRSPVALGGGLTRRYPGALLAVEVHLPRLVEQTSGANPERFLAKIGTLARLARSAGHSKQDFLRRRGRPQVARGFLLDRARLVVVPVGLEQAVRDVTMRRLCDNGVGAEFGRQIVRVLREALTQERPRAMETVLDSSPSGNEFPTAREVGGLTAWEPDALPRQQLRIAGELHALANGGCATILLPTSAMPPTTEIAALLFHAWRYCDVSRVKFSGCGPSPPQIP